MLFLFNVPGIFWPNKYFLTVFEDRTRLDCTCIIFWSFLKILHILGGYNRYYLNTIGILDLEFFVEIQYFGT